MPLYDFRCADCASEREARVAVARAGDMELVCTACGGTMRKAISRTVAFVTGAASASPQAPPRSALRRHSCSDSVVNLTRPNPFGQNLLSTPDGD
ncbi:hypothetical protein BH09ACT8_BH09ACT8_22770 [soil metagenome]